VLLLIGLLLSAAPKIAVLDVRTGAGVDPALGPYLAQVLAKEVADRTGASPLVSADVTAMLGFERNKRMLGCSEEDSQCLAEITGALGVEQVLASSVSVSSGRYLLAMSLLDSRKARPIKRAAQSAPQEEEELVRAVRRSAWEIFGGAEPVPPKPERKPLGRRGWAVISGAGGLAFAIAGGVLGATALSAAKSGDAGTARPRAHIADAFFGAAAICAGVGVYLWFSDKPALASAGAGPSGGYASLRVAF
jgi:hypothetical protein